VGGVLAPLAVAMLVYDQHTLPVRRGCRVLEQELEAAPVELLLIPAGLREEPLQALGLLSLRPGHRLGVGQGSEGLVALGRQQQSLKVTPKAFALGASAQQIVEAESVVLQGAWGGGHGQPSGHGDTSLARHWSTGLFLLQQSTARQVRLYARWLFLTANFSEYRQGEGR